MKPIIIHVGGAVTPGQHTIEGAVRTDAGILCLSFDAGATPDRITSWKPKAWLMIGGKAVGLFDDSVQITIHKAHFTNTQRTVDGWAKLMEAGAELEVTYTVAESALVAVGHRHSTQAKVPKWVFGYLHESYKRMANPLPHLRRVIPGEWEFHPPQRGSALSNVLLDGVVVWQGKTPSGQIDLGRHNAASERQPTEDVQ